MSELKPCPCCGGEAEIDGYKTQGSGFCAHVRCKQCKIGTQVKYEFVDQLSAFDWASTAWNTRYERTCKWVYDDFTDSWDTECGGKIIWGPDGMPVHCPDCGAKAVLNE